MELLRQSGISTDSLAFVCSSVWGSSLLSLGSLVRVNPGEGHRISYQSTTVPSHFRYMHQRVLKGTIDIERNLSSLVGALEGLTPTYLDYRADVSNHANKSHTQMFPIW